MSPTAPRILPLQGAREDTPAPLVRLEKKAWREKSAVQALKARRGPLGCQDRLALSGPKVQMETKESQASRVRKEHVEPQVFLVRLVTAVPPDSTESLTPASCWWFTASQRRFPPAH